MPKRALVTFAVTLLFVVSFLTLQAFADSQVRIVRLSTVDGSVQIDRAVGEGFEKAMANLPITQGAKLRAEGEGRAEIEFEDRSTVRIVSRSAVDFPLLSLRDSGARATTVHVQEGTIYVTFAGKKDDEFAVSFGRETIHLTEPVHFRVEMNDTTAVLAVFKGDLTVEGPAGKVDVSKKQSVTFDLADSDRFKLSKNLAELPFDEWDKKQDQYHDAYLARNSSNISPYAYGMSDLNYYGNFFNLAGYGTLWQPYFIGAGWDPFMSGAWAWYPGSGYMWVSSYPWGWMPYRYGSWLFVPSYGWAWQPGSTWNSWGAMPVVRNAPPNFATPRPPAFNAPVRNTLMVNRGINAPAAGFSGSKVVLRTNSAGLGVPRGGIRNPAQVSQELTQRGSMTVHVQRPPAATPPRSASPVWVNPSSGQGYPPSGSASAPSGMAPVSSRPAASAPAPRSAGPSPRR